MFIQSNAFLHKNILLYLILFFFSLTQSLAADEFDISASNIKLLQGNKKIVAEGKPEEICNISQSHTAKFLKEMLHKKFKKTA